MRMNFVTGFGEGRYEVRLAKSETLQIRLSSEDVALLDRAARITGRSRSALLREQGLAAARAIVEAERPFRWSNEAIEALEAHLAAGTAEPNSAMVDLLSRKPAWE